MIFEKRVKRPNTDYQQDTGKRESPPGNHKLQSAILSTSFLNLFKLGRNTDFDHVDQKYNDLFHKDVCNSAMSYDSNDRCDRYTANLENNSPDSDKSFFEKSQPTIKQNELQEAIKGIDGEGSKLIAAHCKYKPIYSVSKF